jgi:ferredoxin
MSENTQSGPKKGAFVNPMCIGCTLCTQICPGVFEMQDNGKSKAVRPSNDTEEKIQQAIDSCPVNAISWKEYSE